MKKQSRNFLVIVGNNYDSEFVGTVTWTADHVKVSSIKGIWRNSFESYSCTDLKVDENSQGNIFALYV